MDDGSFVSQNPMVTEGFSLAGLRQAFSLQTPAPMYIPVLWISYMLDASILGREPWAFHLVNTLLHGLNTLLLFLLLRRLAGRFSPAGSEPSVFSVFLLALLWALHPLRIESVAWIAERKDCLSVCFGILSLLAWLPAADPAEPRARRTAFAAVSLALFAVGMLAKPSLAPLPVLFAVIAWPPMRRRPAPWRLALALLPFFAMTALCALATVFLHAEHNSPTALPLSGRLATFPSIVFFYASKFLFPRGLALLYPKWTSPLWFGALLGFPLLCAAVWIIRQRRARPLLWLGSLFAILFLLPVSGLLDVPFNLVADRYTCLPAIGLSIALLSFFPSRTGNPRRFPLVVLAAFVAVLAAATACHLPSWRSTAAVYRSSRARVPDHPVIRAFDAQQARNHGDYATAVRCIARLIDADSDCNAIDYSLILSLATSVSAIDGPETALRFILNNPAPPATFAAAWHVFVTAERLALGQYREALEDARRARGILPRTTSARRYVLFAGAIAAWHLSRTGEALEFAHLARAIPPDGMQFGPADFLPYYTYLWDNGFRREALPAFREIATACPRPDVLNNVAWTLATAFGSPAPPGEALGYARAAIAAAGPGGDSNPVLLDTLAAALANASDFPAAIGTATRAIDFAQASEPDLAAKIAARLALYRQSLPARVVLGRPAEPEDYAYAPPDDL